MVPHWMACIQACGTCPTRSLLNLKGSMSYLLTIAMVLMSLRNHHIKLVRVPLTALGQYFILSLLKIPILTNFSILFIHGLNANSVSTWTSVDKYWPRDILPYDSPQACVMTYDYDSELGPSSMLLNNISPEKSLVYNIVDWQRSRSSTLPLLFSAYSFGGILLQKVGFHEN